MRNKIRVLNHCALYAGNIRAITWRDLSSLGLIALLIWSSEQSRPSFYADRTLSKFIRPRWYVGIRRFPVLCRFRWAGKTVDGNISPAVYTECVLPYWRTYENPVILFGLTASLCLPAGLSNLYFKWRITMYQKRKNVSRKRINQVILKVKVELKSSHEFTWRMFIVIRVEDLHKYYINS